MHWPGRDGRCGDSCALVRFRLRRLILVENVQNSYKWPCKGEYCSCISPCGVLTEGNVQPVDWQSINRSSERLRGRLTRPRKCLLPSARSQQTSLWASEMIRSLPQAIWATCHDSRTTKTALVTVAYYWVMRLFHCPRVTSICLVITDTRVTFWESFGAPAP